MLGAHRLHRRTTARRASSRAPTSPTPRPTTARLRLDARGDACRFGADLARQPRRTAAARDTADETHGRRDELLRGYIRQQENQQLGLPRETVDQFSPRLRELVGYGVYNMLIGHINKQSPESLLLDRKDSKKKKRGSKTMVWDGI
jgi:hypothetical protein